MKSIIIKFLSFFNFIINTIIYISLIIILLISIYSFYDSYQIYDSVKVDDYTEEEVVNINKNIIGHIKIDDTSIDYPILQGSDNNKYLNVNYKEEYSYSGSIFMDYRNTLDDNYYIIYGHSLKAGGMFSDIKKYKDKEYFSNHLNGTIILNNNKYEIHIILISKVNAFDEVYNLNKSNNEIVNYSKRISINKIDDIDNYDKLLLLSTCSASSKNDRLVLLGFLKSSS